MDIKRITLAESHLVIDLFDQYRSFYKQLTNKALAENFINERLRENESVIFVALETKNNFAIPVGFTQLYPKYSSVSASKNWILNDLYVNGNYRKSGIGQALIKAAIAFAKNKDATYVQLETAVDNYSAQSLYEAIGFEKQEPDSAYLVYRLQIV
ncbi:MAG: acetyltransferase [Mucilaginibacter sp.]|nr:acetyltransferase [Mucilaginibacter sp.]